MLTKSLTNSNVNEIALYSIGNQEGLSSTRITDMSNDSHIDRRRRFTYQPT